MDIGRMMKQAQELQRKMKEAQDEIAKREVSGEAGAGLVKITMNGLHDALKTQLDDSVTAGLSAEDKEMLEDLITAAINNANQKIKETSESAMSGVTGGMNLPGGLDLKNFLK